MLDILQISGNVIMTKCSAVINAMDYGKLHPIIHNLLKQSGGVRWYIEITGSSSGESFHSDGLLHAMDFEKICCVGDIDNLEWLAEFVNLFPKAEIALYDLKDSATAKDWITK